MLYSLLQSWHDMIGQNFSFCFILAQDRTNQSPDLNLLEHTFHLLKKAKAQWPKTKDMQPNFKRLFKFTKNTEWSASADA